LVKEKLIAHLDSQEFCPKGWISFNGFYSGNWPARTQQLQSHDCPCDCQSIVFRKIYMISARALSLTWNETPSYVKAILHITPPVLISHKYCIYCQWAEIYSSN